MFDPVRFFPYYIERQQDGFAFKYMDESFGWDYEWNWGGPEDHLRFDLTGRPGSNNIPFEPGPEPEPEHLASSAPGPTLQSQKRARVRGNNPFGSRGTESCAECRKRKGKVDARTT